MKQLFLDLKKRKISFTVSFRIGTKFSKEEYEVVTFSYITLLLLYFIFKHRARALISCFKCMVKYILVFNEYSIHQKFFQ